MAQSAVRSRAARLTAHRIIPLFLKRGRKGQGMSIQDITTLISTVGFPIVACVALYLQNVKMNETIQHNTEAIMELTTIIKERLIEGG